MSEHYLSINFNTYPVAMYDCAAQKCVAVFRSRNQASLYIFLKEGRINGSHVAQKHKFRKEKNPYFKDITFRAAKEDQCALLKPGEQHVILDPYFELKDGVKKTTYNFVLEESVPNKRIPEAMITKFISDGYSPDEIAHLTEYSTSHIRAKVARRTHIPQGIAGLNKEQLTELSGLIQKRIANYQMIEEMQSNGASQIKPIS